MKVYSKPSKGTQKYTTLSEALIGKTRHGFENLETLQNRRDLINKVFFPTEEDSILQFLTNTK